MLNHPGCTFHHIGIACRDLDSEQTHWEALGYTQESPEFEDPVQRVRGRFLVGPGPRLELLSPTAENSPLEGVLKRRTKLYHQAFEVADFDQVISELDDLGLRATAAPARSVAFGGRRIVFMMMGNGNLIEIIEAGKLAAL